MILLAKELPDLRDRMLRFAEGPLGDFLSRVPIDELHPTQADVDRAARLGADMEAESWRRSELFFIAPSMVDLTMQAKDGIEGAGFMEYDLPGPFGAAMFGADIRSERDMGPGTNLDALPADKIGTASKEEQRQIQLMVECDWPERLLVLWRAMPAEAGYEHGWVKVSWYFERDAWLHSLEVQRRMLDVTDKERAPAWRDIERWMPPYVFDGHTIIACHPDASQLRVERYDGKVSWNERRTDMFRALCYLLRQRIAESETVMPDRAARRRMAREGREPAPVRVISLRGASAHGGGDGSREYVHRWMVRGHWRRQWYPSIQQNRPIWITPYIAGPAGAPLLGGEKVYVVK